MNIQTVQIYSNNFNIGALLRNKGAVLVRGLDKVITTNKELSQMVKLMGEKFTYTAGMATRKEYEDAPGEDL